MSVFVKFWGTRGSIPTPGRRTQRYGGNTLCVEIRSRDQIIICDAGSGIRELGADLMTRNLSPIVVHLFLSHTHWDHIQGFPFFTPVYVQGSHCYIYGVRENDDRFYRLLSGQMVSDYFPIRFADLRANISSRHLHNGQGDVAGIAVSTCELVHPGGCLGYAFVDGSTKVVYATDNEIDKVLLKPAAYGSGSADLRIVSKPMLDFVQGADLLITDSQYTDAEYTQKVGWGHPSCLTAVDFAAQANVKRLALIHHDPLHSDADVETMVEACRKRAKELHSNLDVFAAREGVELKV